jgi:hypothetical protein
MVNIGNKTAMMETIEYLCNKTDIMNSNIDNIINNVISQSRNLMESFTQKNNTVEDINKFMLNKKLQELDLLNYFFLKPLFRQYININLFSYLPTYLTQYSLILYMFYYINILIGLIRLIMESAKIRKDCYSLTESTLLVI